MLAHQAPPLPLGREARKLGEVGQASTETLQCKATICRSPGSRGGASGRRWLSHHKRGWSNLEGLGKVGRFVFPSQSLGSFLGYRRQDLKCPRQTLRTTERRLLGCVFRCMCMATPP